MNSSVYSKDELFAGNAQKRYPDDATECKFLLGGIGTGNVSVGSRGQLCDWEIFNRQGKGTYLPYTFFAIWTRDDKGEPLAKILESEIKKPYERSHGYLSGDMAGIPRLQSAEMRGEYPFVSVDFVDRDLPLKVSMEAFTPFIPLNADDSGIPGFVIRYHVKNLSNMDKEVTVAGSLANAVGFEEYDLFGNMMVKEEGKNEYRREGNMSGLYYTSPGLDKDHPRYGSMALATPSENVTVKPEWLIGAWWDGAHNFWDDFCSDGKLEEKSESTAVESTFNFKSNLRIGTLGICEKLSAQEEKTFEFIVAWHFPNRPKAWEGHICPADNHKAGHETNYYAAKFKDAWDCAAYLQKEQERLEKSSRDFHRALFSSTLPGYVVEALAANITVLRSTTCFRIHDGTFLAWEGCFNHRGSCEGNCTHVWNYAQTLAFLFPELEHSMRRTEFLQETDEQGNMAFRAMQVFGDPKWDMLPATDGQMGTIIRLHRDWKLSGDDGLLREVWGKASKALDFAFEYWDRDGDFVLESQQHNTYDIEFYGPNSLTNSMFFAALKAGVEMAEHLGDGAHARKYGEALRAGAEKMDKLLWGGEYYVQVIDDVNRYRYQYGIGCLSDQVFGQMLAHLTGLGYILPEEHVKKAIQSVFEYNFRTSMRSHQNVQRTYALNGEKGLLLCSWPHGGRPGLPFVYSDEVWTGIEYQVAAHLIFEGFVEEGLTVVKAVRERYDGYNRNPWNEVECGNHYARSMASWAVLIALSGYKYDLVEGKISFAPVICQQEFSTFFSNGKCWGIYRQNIDAETGHRKWETEVLYGSMDGITVNENGPS